MENFTAIPVTNSTGQHSDHDGMLSTGTWVAVILMSILIVPIVILNIAVGVVILKYKPLRTGSYLLIFSLAMADTCIGLFVIPGIISSHFYHGVIGNILCMICSYTSFVSEAAAVVSLTAISLDRVRAVLWPLKPKLTNRRTWFIIFTIWFFGMVYGIRGGLTFALKGVRVESAENETEVHTMCMMTTMDDVVRKALMALDFICLFIIPAVIVTICYLTILWKTRKHMERMSSVRINSNILRQKKLKAVRMSLLMISIFVFLHLPKHAMVMYASSDGVVMEYSVILLNCFLIISFLNSVVNPILYGFLNIKIRNACCGVYTRRRSAHTGSRTGRNNRWSKYMHNDIQVLEASSGENKDGVKSNSTTE